MKGVAPTGVFIPRNKYGNLPALIDAIKYFIGIEDSFTVEACVTQASRFSPQVFFKSWREFCLREGVDPGLDLNGSDRELKRYA